MWCTAHRADFSGWSLLRAPFFLCLVLSLRLVLSFLLLLSLCLLLMLQTRLLLPGRERDRAESPVGAGLPCTLGVKPQGQKQPMGCGHGGLVHAQSQWVCVAGTVGGPTGPGTSPASAASCLGDLGLPLLGPPPALLTGLWLVLEESYAP